MKIIEMIFILLIVDIKESLFGIFPRSEHLLIHWLMVTLSHYSCFLQFLIKKKTEMRLLTVCNV